MASLDEIYANVELPKSSGSYPILHCPNCKDKKSGTTILSLDGFRTQICYDCGYAMRKPGYLTLFKEYILSFFN